MKNFNRPPWFKAPRTGATRTLSGSHTFTHTLYINAVTIAVPSASSAVTKFGIKFLF